MCTKWSAVSPYPPHYCYYPIAEGRGWRASLIGTYLRVRLPSNVVAMASESESLYVCVPGTQSETDLLSYYRCITWYTRHCMMSINQSINQSMSVQSPMWEIARVTDYDRPINL